LKGFRQLAQLHRRFRLFRSCEEPRPQERLPQARPAREDGERDGEYEREDDGRYPPEEGGVRQVDERAPEDAEYRPPPVNVDGVRPWGSPVVAGLGRPTDVFAQNGRENEDAVMQHPHGGQQRGERHLQQNAAGEPEPPPVKTRRRIAQKRQRIAEELGEEEQHRGRAEERERPVRPPDRPLREERLCVEEVDRLQVDLCHGLR